MLMQLEDASADERAAAYRGIRARVRVIVEAAAAGTLDAPCAPTPAWSVHDVLAHLVGVPSDILAGRLDGVASDAWTQAQVDARRDTSVGEMLDAWDVDSALVEPMMSAFPPATLGQMIYDATTHEHDLRHGLGACGAHDTDAVVQSFAWLVLVAGAGRDAALELRTEAGDVVVGNGDPVATIGLSRFEFVRAASGRRSAEQIAAYDWHGSDPRPELLLTAPLFSLATAALHEAPTA